jgi:hypothetical protein
MGLSKIQNLKHKYKITKTQLPRKLDCAQSSIERRSIPSNDPDALLRGLEKTPTILDE